MPTFSDILRAISKTVERASVGLQSPAALEELRSREAQAERDEAYRTKSLQQALLLRFLGRIAKEEAATLEHERKKERKAIPAPLPPEQAEFYRQRAREAGVSADLFDAIFGETTGQQFDIPLGAGGAPEEAPPSAPAGLPTPPPFALPPGAPPLTPESTPGPPPESLDPEAAPYTITMQEALNKFAGKLSPGVGVKVGPLSLAGQKPPKTLERIQEEAGAREKGTMLAKAGEASKTAGVILSALKGLANEVNQEENPWWAQWVGLKKRVRATVGYGTESSYLALGKSYREALTRSQGRTVGVMTEGDINRSEAGWPKFTDTKQVKDFKISILEQLNYVAHTANPDKEAWATEIQRLLLALENAGSLGKVGKPAKKRDLTPARKLEFDESERILRESFGGPRALPSHGRKALLPAHGQGEEEGF